MKNSTDGFTLLELVVVAGIAAVLVMLLATAAANSRPNVRVVQCLARMKQLTAAWTMYAHDYSDRVPNNFAIPGLLLSTSAKPSCEITCPENVNALLTAKRTSPTI